MRSKFRSTIWWCRVGGVQPGDQPGLWDDDKMCEISLPAVIFNHLLLLNLHWLSQLWVLQTSHEEQPHHRLRPVTFYHIPTSYQISLRCYYVRLYYYWCWNPISPMIESLSHHRSFCWLWTLAAIFRQVFIPSRTETYNESWFLSSSMSD